MKSKLERAKTQPHIMCGPGDVAAYALLPGHVQRPKMIAETMEEARKVADNREFVTYTGTYSEIPVTATSTGIGGPSASIALEELANLGAKTFIRVGTTGSLQEGIEIGDIVIATAAIRSEGTSQCYVPTEYPAVADLTLTTALQRAAEEAKGRYHVGIICSYDAYYAETEDRLRAWSQAGALSIDCESASIFVAASLRRLRAGSIMVVDGNLVKGTKKGEFAAGKQEGELNPRVRAAVRKEIKIALEAIRLLERRRTE
ncbi:MAG TPA: nucleoside phosphorylase [Candidatus Acidoferrales bacterium]|nr:nucleoside phosphorylase [Candidatus Acidoferrales bacterium]